MERDRADSRRVVKTVRLPEDTDQRVIGLNSPGSTNRAIWMAYQLLNPGERVASHRHTPAQMRFIVQGTGAYTTAEGERMLMEPGDLLVQSNWTWHGSVTTWTWMIRKFQTLILRSS